MFHNMLVTGLAPLNNTIEFVPWNSSQFITTEAVPQKDSKLELAKIMRKKLRRRRTSFTWEQLRILESVFEQTPYIDGHRRREISQKLNIGDKSIKIWFQNRRMKKKRQSSESSDSHTEPEVSSTSESPAVVVPAVENKPIADKTYVLPDNIPTYLPPETEAIKYDTVFGFDTNLYPTQYYPNNAPTYNTGQNETFQNYNENNFWGSNFNDFML